MKRVEGIRRLKSKAVERIRSKYQSPGTRPNTIEEFQRFFK
jgi:hypothetical protein